MCMFLYVCVWPCRPPQPCAPGFFCGPGSTSATQGPCSTSAAHYCPEGAPSPVASPPGWYTTPMLAANASHQTAASPCETGFFCAGGVRSPCPPGSFGNSSQLQSVSCSGACTAGYVVLAAVGRPLQVSCVHGMLCVGDGCCRKCFPHSLSPARMCGAGTTAPQAPQSPPRSHVAAPVCTAHQAVQPRW